MNGKTSMQSIYVCAASEQAALSHAFANLNKMNECEKNDWK